MKCRVTYPATIYFDVEGDTETECLNKALGELVGDAYNGFDLRQLDDGRVYPECNQETGEIDRDKIELDDVLESNR